MRHSVVHPVSPGSIVAAIALLAMGAVPSSAEIVVLTSGRTVAVVGHRFDGDQVALRLRSGGELICEARAIDRILPDEVPDFTVPAPAPASSPGASEPVDDLIAAAAATHGVDVRLVRAIIQVESAFRPGARSPKGAMGLMQLMPKTAAQYSVVDAFEPAANLDAGVRHLRRLLERYEVPLALAAYNAGEAAVQRYGGIPPYRETVNYVRQVIRILERTLADEDRDR